MSGVTVYPCSMTAPNWSFQTVSPTPSPAPAPTPTPSPGPVPPPAKRNYLYLYVIAGIVGLFLLLNVFKR